MQKTEQRMPAVALRGMTILPEMITHFDVSRSRSVKAVEKALTQEQKLFVVTQRDPDTEEPGQEDLFAMGTVVEVKQIVKMPHNILRVLVEGVSRAQLLELSGEEYLEALLVEVEPEDFGELPQSGREAMFRNLQDIFRKYCEQSGRVGKDLSRQVLDSQNLERLMAQVMIHTPFSWEQQQRLLETADFPESYETLCIMLNNEIEVEQFRRGIQEKVKARVDKQQKDYILREQMQSPGR